ncbi:amidase domain-containing protein [Sarocladium implicatum]|nr:amidase domain-containing protein [Sarocladium implicatum]
MRLTASSIIIALAATLGFASCTPFLTTFTPGPGFDIREATIDSIHQALDTEEVNCRDVVSAFLSRIEAFNPKINAILSSNPQALQDADRLDSAPGRGGKLHCIPILLKDNYDAVGVPTTAGCKALAHAQPSEDAPVVTALKAEGAIILGKVNMHEMALEGLSVSSLGGQTLNPYDLSRTPGGSSGGSGAAVAASLAVLATGTDTVNSLRNPASANNLFSFRPTRGLISRAGVVPVSYTQDALGVMGRSVRDIATALEVMTGVGYDPADNATIVRQHESQQMEYDAALFGGSLLGKRVGVLSGFYNYTPSDETTPVIESMASMERMLLQSGAELVNITTSIFDGAGLQAKVDVQTFEYREMLNEYLQRDGLKGEPRPKSFEELYRDKEFLVIPHQYEYIRAAHERSTSDPAYHARLETIRQLTRSLHEEFRVNDLDAIIYPQQRNLVIKVGSPSQAGRNGILAAVTGSPVVVVPVGWSEPSEDAPLGVPIGMEMLGMPFSEAKLLNIAHLISGKASDIRQPPLSAAGHVQPKSYAGVPNIKPACNHHPLYPLGTLA